MSDDALGGTARAQIATRVVDLGLGGALLVMSRPLEVGSIYDFTLEIDGEPLWVQAEVRRFGPADRGPGHHIGVQFLGMDPHEQQRLQEYLARRQRS